MREENEVSETTEKQRAAWMESDGEHLNARCVKMLLRDYAALEKLLHDAIDVLRHANKYFPLTSAQIVLVRYRKLYPKGRRTK